MLRFIKLTPRRKPSELPQVALLSADQVRPPSPRGDTPEATSSKKICTRDPPHSELGLQVTKTLVLPSHGVIKLARGSVVEFQGDSIVNAANVYGLGGGGVDGAINACGGEEFELERERKLEIAVPGTKIRIPTGTAKSTRACGSLQCKFVVHAVGPNYYKYENAVKADSKLASAYKAAMEEARRIKANQTVAFSLLSAGVYRGNKSLHHVLQIAVNTLKLQVHQGETAYLVAFSDAEHDTLEALLNFF